MDEQQKTRRNSGLGRILWILVIVAIVILWWYFKPDSAEEVAVAEIDNAALAEMDHDTILIDLADDATPDAIEREYNLTLTLVDQSGVAEETRLYRADVDAAQRVEIIEALSKRDDVEIVEPDAMYMLEPGFEPLEVRSPEPSEPGYPNDPLYPKQWHMRQIGMPDAWKMSDGKGVIVAVLDTGVAYEDHGSKFKLLPDLDGVEFVKPYDFVANSKHANDDHGHGSHVTGTIAQVTNNSIGVAGVAPKVRIMPLKVLSANGSGSVAGIADAIRYAADNGAKVINMSLGGAFPSSVLKKAVKYAHDKGVTVICAAGNESRGKVAYPAAYPGAVAISATREDEATTFYSNWGKEIDLAAPGGDTRDKNGGRNNPDGGVLQNTIVIGKPQENGYFAYMGTSMAAPHAAAVAALVVGEGITNPKRVEQVMKDTARKPKNQKYDAERYGAGIIDAPAAIKKARTSTGGGSLVLGLLMAGAVAASARRNGGLGVKLGWTYLTGVLVGASGLFFLPYLAPEVSSWPVVGALTQGLPSWDLSLFGHDGHGNALFFSALIPLGLLALAYGVPKLRAPVAGVAIGVAAHLAFFAAVPMATVQAPIIGVAAIWLAINAIACLWLARLALRK